MSLLAWLRGLCRRSRGPVPEARDHGQAEADGQRGQDTKLQNAGRGDRLPGILIRTDVLIENRRLRTWFEDVETAVQRMDEAEERSQYLLRSWLSPEQLTQYDTFGHFMVVGCDTGRCYRISRGRAFNIHELDAGAREHCTWCFAQTVWLRVTSIWHRRTLWRTSRTGP